MTGARRFCGSQSEAGWNALQQLHETIRFADVKAAAVLAAAGLLGGSLCSGQDSLTGLGPAWSPMLPVLSAVAAATSALLALHTLMPRREAAASEPLQHFAYVAKRYGRNSQGFVDAWLATTVDEHATARMLAGHVWAAHMVASRKFAYVTWSIRLLVLGVLAWLVAGLV
ncbi:Pycsar system effector family protein [Salinispora cortesiana]|uniref:Pycsar system effector family protein n=1 Tax=Salinispora cortesiana TaxID=1305843 RepID=UPI000471B773|nr:Pycsar system effector family protein [Salinispora cortesiana]